PFRTLRHSRPLAAEKVAKIPMLYKTMPGPKVAALLQTTCTAVYLYLRLADVPIRSANDYDREAPCRHDFFDVIDTPEKAYWLGMMITDGSVSRNDEIILSLHERDSVHVEAFRAAL